MTSLHDAAERGNLKKCRKLIEQGADVNAKDEDGCTPLHKATWYGHLEICECLFLKCGAKMGSYSLSKYREYSHSQLNKLFQYFKTETDESLCNILTQSDDTIRPFIDALIHNQVTPVFDQRDTFMDRYACDLFCLYHRYPQIRVYIENGLGFQTVRWELDKRYMRRYRSWLKRWYYEFQNNRKKFIPLLRLYDDFNKCHVLIEQGTETPLIIPTFTHRLTQNIKYRITN